MNRRLLALVLIPLAGLLVTLSAATAEPRRDPRPFKAADLKIEINSTDGDAGLQVFLDDEAWKQIRIVNPAGQAMVGLEAKGPLRDYGLTELFSESSEPPFGVFPLEEFKRLFPEGDYVFSGTLVDGTKLRSKVPLTHDLADGPRILRPRDGSERAPDAVVVRWEPAQTPTGIEIVGYEVLVVREDGSRTLASTSRRRPGSFGCRRSSLSGTPSTRPRCWRSKPAATRPSPRPRSR